MAKKTVISKVLPVNTNADIIEFPQNRTLMIEQLTYDPPAKAEINKDCRSLEDVFDHYKPKITAEFDDVSGQTKKEEVHYKSLKDFEAKNLVKNSQFLKDLETQKNIYNEMEQQLKKNKVFRDAISDSQSKQGLILAMQALVAELKGNSGK